jgi:glycosyltransferase involved in cell wall biosynthesis
MPNVVMEALAAARPVVATRVGGVTELVEQDQSGLLVPPRDPSALSQAMRQVMSLSLEQRRRMGLRGRQQVATHYTLAAMAGRWMGLYQDLLKQPLAGSRAAE